MNSFKQRLQKQIADTYKLARAAREILYKRAEVHIMRVPNTHNFYIKEFTLDDKVVPVKQYVSAMATNEKLASYASTDAIVVIYFKFSFEGAEYEAQFRTQRSIGVGNQSPIKLSMIIDHVRHLSLKSREWLTRETLKQMFPNI